MSKIFIGILIFILGVIAGPMVEKIPILSNLRIPYLAAKPTPTPTLLPTPTPTPDVTVNWKTYTSKYNYTVQYPPGFKVRTGEWMEGVLQYGLQPEDEAILNFVEPNQPPHGGFLYGTNIALKIPVNNPQKLSATDWANDQVQKNNINPSNLSIKYSIQPTTIAGIVAAKMSYNFQNNITEVFIPWQGKMYKIVFADFLPAQSSLQNSGVKLSYNYEEIYNQILSTFKFTNTTPSDIDDVRNFVDIFAQTYVDANWTKLKSLLTVAMANDMAKNQVNLSNEKYLSGYRIVSIDKNTNPDGYTATIEFLLNGKPMKSPTGRNPAILIVKENGAWKSLSWYLFQ